MLTAVSRYGARVLPNTNQIVADVDRRGQLVEGPHVAAFERTVARRLGIARAVTASYGRMAFYYTLQALELPPGSEIVVPALTFWVVPEMARVAGLSVVFADVDPRTGNLDPAAFERAITPRTRVVVPTHLYGLPCEMDGILRLARRHGIFVIEDCAHALGAVYRGRPAGTLGDAAFFSFQLLKPLNTYGGGMAVTADGRLAERIERLARAEPLPTRDEVHRRLRLGQVQRTMIRPGVFSWAVFPWLWLMSWTKTNPDVYLWEKIRPLSPLPPDYRRRYSNVQAALGIEALEWLDTWTERTRAHAHAMDAWLDGVPGVERPVVPPDLRHVYYQYCVRGSTTPRADAVRRCIRRGVDVESLHVDVCPALPLFGGAHEAALNAELASDVLQLPVYESLSPARLSRVGQVAAAAFSPRSRRSAPTGDTGREGSGVHLISRVRPTPATPTSSAVDSSEPSSNAGSRA